jgi:type VI secretion system secreted protein VgrG
LNFVLRLLQEEGLFFYFEHAKDGHKLVIVDDSTRAKSLDGPSALIPYSQNESMDDIDVITSLQSSRHLASGSSALKSRDYKVPGARRSALSTAQNVQGDVPAYQIYDYLGEHAYPDTERGQQLARFRTEALAAGSKVFSGTSTSRRLAPMRYIQIEKHYDHKDAQPEDRQFMLITVTHSGRNNYQPGGGGGASYHCTFTCIRKKIPYREALTIERPTISGPQTAIVVGPPGETIYTDEMGRVKVQFHWDRLGKRDQASSCWVRQSQPWAGRGFGMIHIPRIGDEVLVSFLEGSPDRPIISGRVVNGINRAHGKLPNNKALSGLRSRDLKGAQSNQIVADDTPGELQVQVASA